MIAQSLGLKSVFQKRMADAEALEEKKARAAAAAAATAPKRMSLFEEHQAKLKAEYEEKLAVWEAGKAAGENVGPRPMFDGGGGHRNIPRELLQSDSLSSRFGVAE